MSDASRSTASASFGNVAGAGKALGVAPPLSRTHVRPLAGVTPSGRGTVGAGGVPTFSGSRRVVMKDVEAVVTIVDTQAGQMFARRFLISPIRIGSGRHDHLRLREARLGSGQAEIFFDQRGAAFRRRSWFRKSWIDGVRAKRGRAMPLSAHSIVTIGRFEISVAVRRRETERARKVTPLSLVRPPGWEGRWNLELLAEPYLALETLRADVDPEGLDGELSKMAASVARDFHPTDRRRSK